MSDTQPKNIFAAIERIQGKIFSLQVENRHLRLVMESSDSEEWRRSKAAKEIRRLKDDVEDKQRAIYYLAWKLSNLEKTLAETKRGSEFRKVDRQEKNRHLEQDIVEPKNHFRQNTQRVQDSLLTSKGPTQKKQPPGNEAKVSMAKRKAETKWYSPLSLVRSTGKAVGFVQYGTMSSFSKIDQALFSRKKEKQKQQQAKTWETPPPSVGPETETGPTGENNASPVHSEATEPPVSEPMPITEEKPAQEEIFQQTEIHERKDTLQHDVVNKPQAKELSESSAETDKLPGDEKTGQTRYFPLDLKMLLKRNLPTDRIEAIKLRNAVDDLLYGSEVSRRRALEALVSFGRLAEPFLVFSLNTGSPKVAEAALKSLHQIGSDRFVACISDLLASSDPERRIVALRTAQRLTEDLARPFLEQGLRDPCGKVKRRVISYLSWYGSSWALIELRRLCDDPDVSVKWAALEALLTVRPSEAYDNLELIMPHLPSAYQRRAVTLLRQRKH